MITHAIRITATSTDPSGSSTITSNFQESIVIDNSSKSFGIEAFATVETDNGKPGMKAWCLIYYIIWFSEFIDIKLENSVTSTSFTVNIKVSNQQ